VRAAIDETAGLTDPGVVMGTAGYMPPEQLTGSGVDLRADVFAIGVMATEAIIGRRPFRGKTPGQMLLAIANDPVTLAGEGEERRRMQSILRRATASDPTQRYASVTTLARELIPALRALPAATQDADTRTAFATGNGATQMRPHSGTGDED
jgi:serine/threonine-protein kinase